MKYNYYYRTMNNQFKNEPLEEKPDINKSYYISKCTKSKDLTHLMKLVLCTRNNEKAFNIIKSITKDKSDEINKQNTKGCTTLILACRNSNTESNIETVKLLLEDPNIDINIHNNDGYTALMVACRNSNTDSNIETVKLLLENPKINVNKQTNNGWTALMIACNYSNTRSNIETVKLLLDDPQVDINKQNNDGWTALMMACKFVGAGSNIGTVKLLLENPNIDVNKQNKEGLTALMFACKYGHIEIVNLLLEHPNTDINKQNSDGNTALMVTSKYCPRGLKKIMDIFMGSDVPLKPLVNLLTSESSILCTNSWTLRNKMNIYLKNKEGKSIIDMIPISNEFIEFLHNNNIEINNSILNRIIEKDIIGTEILIPYIFNPLIFNYRIIGEILKRHDDHNIIYCCYLHTNVKKKVLNQIQSQKEELYYKPNNIIALCSEVNFKLKFKDPTEIFKELNEKLKYIFDIKNEEDMIEKITFYL